MKFLFILLALFFLMNSSIPVLAYQDNTDQEIKISRRAFTNQDIDRLKSKIGVAREGVNYNVKINGYGTGLIPPTEEQWAKMKARAVFVEKMTFADASAPVSHDNSATIWFPPIGQQGSEGSCVAWATGYYNKTFQEAREHNWDLSGCTWDNGWGGYPSAAYQDKIFSPDFIYHQINGGVDGGSYYSDAMNILYRTGCATWDNMPYDMNNSTDWPSESAWRQAPIYRSGTPYNYAYVSTDTQINNLKQFLANYNNAVIAIDANYYSSLTSDDVWTSDSYLASGSNHANLIIGYDDNFGPYTEGGTTKYGAFKVANSWGIGNWENVNDGFYWISYECMKQNIGAYMFYENLVGYEPEMISVFSLDHDLRGECQVTVGMGSSSSPSVTKLFDDYYYNGGDHAYPANVMVMDITEFGTPADAENLFIKVYDGETTAIGQINSFSIETYNDYASGTPTATYLSNETPVSTVAGINVFANLQTADDSTPPASISDLQVTSTSSYSATLSWTASGDDGTSGTAASYDIRYSQSQINQLNFGAATIVNNLLVPLEAGTLETFTVDGLNNSTTYYFAIKIFDDCLNESEVSNAPSGITLEDQEVPIDLSVLSSMNSGDNDCFNAQNDIIVSDSDNVDIANGASATFIAGHSIRFLPGFHAQPGSYVDAHITESESFCNDLLTAPMMAAQPIADKSVEPEQPKPDNNSFNHQNMVVYPNPNNGRFTIKLENIESETRVLMYSAIGQKVYDITMTEQLHTVELPDLQRGIYFIKAINNQKQFDQKIVIQ